MILKTKLWAFFAILLSLCCNADAQVTVGSNEPPAKYATLQIRDRAVVAGESQDTITAINGGMLLPRVNLTRRYQLLPFVSASDTTSADYKNIQKPAHTGLIVYNINKVVDEDLFIGINQWDGEKWNGLQERLGNAIAKVTNCDSLNFMGTYENKVALNSGNYMTIPLRVTKTGAYTITAIPDPDNGYFFTISGVFYSTGYYYITIPGAGIPKNYTPSSGLGSQGDKMVILFNNNDVGCEKYLKIKDSSIRPKYTLRCNTTVTHGVYKLNTELGIDNYIDVYLDVDPSSYGAAFEIKTDAVDGIYFKASGILSSSSQAIKLMGFGKPTSTGKKTMTISTNSESDVATCLTFVDVALTPKTILTLGTYSAIYGYSFAGSPTNSLGLSQSAKLVKTSANFGISENSIVKVESITVNSGVVGDYNPSAATLKPVLEAMPDIVILGVYYVPDATACQYFIDYLAKGGVLLAFLEFDGAERINQTIFANKAITSTTINNGGAVYSLPYNNDEILNGPFGDIRGKQWGEDATPTRAFSNIPSGSVIAYSTGDDMTQSATANTDKLTMFRHTSLNYLYCGDGGFNSGYADFTYRLAYPFHVNESANNKPIPRSAYGRAAPYYDVYNSVLTANAIAWGLKKAQEREDTEKNP